jgi:hypothetical protein
MDAAIGVIAGFFLGVAADIVRQWLNRKTRREERSEKAAQDLIALLDEARAPFANAYRRNAEIDMNEVQGAVTKLRQKSLLLANQEGQERIELVAEVLESHFGAQEFTGDSYSSIAWGLEKRTRNVEVSPR